MREKILTDLKEAMKAQDKELLTVIRMVKSAIQMEELKVKHPLTDDEVIAIISHEIKTRKESIKEFEKGNRSDLIDKTNGEIERLKRYMPEQMSDEEIQVVLDEAFSKINPIGPSDMGKIMGLVTPQLKGKADLSQVSQMIRERLGS